ncbi:hypothetical protein HBH56_135610 [Parastagonospora nodorum]|uniref:YDG domain-containing protein n=1 Tax=Phaeosphaeria nodorum (strain SN15 / ATCC MYA-4574 / FGSC 10173) TaxID=321614 RepID=A0A7U2I5M3_PHANO|nr:hypothetical protein HBH56_135610 [Parastagonospora nodorum]QRD02569.1 hypothetical protein JI435_113250 [Parastagonospora nodorum SN15]KAH3927003.1 hypothetical protein HBH54_157680 [Parastagonospora nodorum]KAH4066681.1 hypothetical protein HBH50_141690 [Parastagonospora nodorum]KAH4086258.1 hypothetical protein HBH48_148300 [Parastagonospora nodorum]
MGSEPDHQDSPASPPRLLQLPQANGAQHFYPAELVHQRFQEARNNPEEFHRKNVEHATRMGVDAEAYLRSLGLGLMRVVSKGTTTIQDSAGHLDVIDTSAHEEPASKLEADVQMKDATSRPEPDNISSSEEDVHMEDATSSAQDVDASTPGSGPWSDDAMSPLEPSRPELQTDAMHLREQIESAPKTKKLNPTAKTPKERKTKKDKAKQNLKNISIHPAAAGMKSRSLPRIAADSSETGTAREAAARSTGPMEQTPSLFVEQTENYPVLSLPNWHVEIKPSNFNMKELAKKRSPSLTALESLKNCIGRCEEQMQPDKRVHRKKLTDYFNELRDHVHKAEFAVINKWEVRTARILNVENGLPRIFGEHAGFPWDLQADAYQLYLRWMRADFEHDVLRGITAVKGPNRGSDRLCPIYRNKHPPNAKRYGHNGLVLGQCWPSQLCTVRDGAHGSSQGGIFGEKEKGTYSIVLSGGGGYDDRDDGDTIVYSGTEGKNSTPTEATQQMITSCTLGNVIRVIRSHHLSTKNKYRPEIGLRYDGLYTAKSYKLVDKEKQTHLFTLERCPGQEKIRYGNGPEGRPTRFEIVEYRKLKEI